MHTYRHLRAPCHRASQPLTRTVQASCILRLCSRWRVVKDAAGTSATPRARTTTCLKLQDKLWQLCGSCSSFSKRTGQKSEILREPRFITYLTSFHTGWKECFSFAFYSKQITAYMHTQPSDNHLLHIQAQPKQKKLHPPPPFFSLRREQTIPNRYSQKHQRSENILIQQKFKKDICNTVSKIWIYIKQI